MFIGTLIVMKYVCGYVDGSWRVNMNMRRCVCVETSRCVYEWNSYESIISMLVSPVKYVYGYADTYWACL